MSSNHSAHGEHGAHGEHANHGEHAHHGAHGDHGDHAARLIERHCDICVVGGSAAGLAAALQFGRQDRSVIVVDAGEPCDGPAAKVRDEARAHGVEVLSGQVTQVARTDMGDFRAELTGGHSIVARLVLNAADLGGELPDLGSADGTEGRPSGNQADWDHRYDGDQIWSGNPNGSLVNEVTGATGGTVLKPGRALDVGAGEGGDALWLAEHGWTVTASDISQRALDRIGAEAGRRGVTVECQHADANARDAFKAGAFDLVSAQYASIPRRPDDRAVRNLLNAVAPGGTLLIVSHDLEPLRAQPSGPDQSRPFDPDAYVRVEDFIAVLSGAPEWHIERHEKLERPAGAASAAHHVHDIVLRARRHGV